MWLWQAGRSRMRKPASANYSTQLSEKGPQIVTRRGAEAAVLVPIEQWRRLQTQARRSAKEVLLGPGPRFENIVPHTGSLSTSPCHNLQMSGYLLGHKCNLGNPKTKGRTEQSWRGYKRLPIDQVYLSAVSVGELQAEVALTGPIIQPRPARLSHGLRTWFLLHSSSYGYPLLPRMGAHDADAPAISWKT